MPTREYFVGDAACMNIKLTMLRVSARLPLRRSGNDTRQTSADEMFMQAASPTKYSLVGMAKDVLIVIGSLWWFHGATTTLQMFGFTLALVSTNLFVYYARNGTLPLLKRSISSKAEQTT
jgi:hypothetical protein